MNDRFPPSRLAASRRDLLVGATVLGTALAAGMARAEDAVPSKGSADFLFVQTAKRMSYDAGANRLSLEGISPVTLFFSDRPERIAGNMETTRFVPFWSEGTDSFLSDPPNADLSILENGVLRQTVVELRDPALEDNGDRLVYTVRIIKGDMPVEGADPSLFIDVIGMPLTPVSFAGADRRAFRRAAFY